MYDKITNESPLQLQVEILFYIQVESTNMCLEYNRSIDRHK